MTTFLLFMLGGGIGSLARYLLDTTTKKHWPRYAAWSIPAINVLGSFVIGFGTGIATALSASHTAALYTLAISFCGGFTTFSTAMFETVDTFRSEQHLTALGTLLGTILLALTATFGGIALGQLIG